MQQYVVADAAALGSDIKSSGHVAVYGITFDTNKSVVRPESKPALNEIAKLLKQDPALKLKVVGHTDRVGSLGANMTLSRARAEAVVQVLVSQYGIAAARLTGYGVGPLAPVASNDTDEGRQEPACGAGQGVAPPAADALRGPLKVRRAELSPLSRKLKAFLEGGRTPGAGAHALGRPLAAAEPSL